MTIVYKAVPSKTRPNYVDGITHSGIPVQVFDEDLSVGKFSDRDAKDVVVHRSHTGCRNAACSGDPLQVGIGHAFSIAHEDEDKIELINTNELKVVYTTADFTKKETSGFLTRHKDRINPRWSIYDGYAGTLSTGCGEDKESSGFEIRVPVGEYASDPSTWELNDNRWSLKAIEIFDLGQVRPDLANGTEIVGRLFKPIEDQKKEFVAIDLTVFAYRDSSWDPSYYKFAGLLQIVNCHSPPIGKTKPTFVKEAYLYFDKKEGDGYDQIFPLEGQQLPRQFSENDQEKIYSYINRSFYYSINSPRDYEDVFDALSGIVPIPTAVANVIARLNASCGQDDRGKCRNLSKFKKP